jgi:molybdopterin-containing oxidoreductase family membrane subunit
MAIAETELLVGTWTDRSLTDRISSVMFRGGRAWNIMLALTGCGAVMLLLAVGYTVVTGIGVWGNNIPVAWAFAITNFVWWIGIGHAGTFISAILLILEQKWRTSLNRIAEGMTLIALVQAGLMPLLHLGRPWFFYWLIPYPSTMDVWPQFMSTLPWDVAAVSTYAIISILFWYLGAVPDFAVVRDKARGLGTRRVYGVLALGWRGSANQWRHFRSAQLLLAGLATPLVLSVHSIVSLDFAISVLPGWHSVLFPPYFVAGAIFSGFAMVVQLTVPVRHVYGLQNVITERHLDLIAKLILLTGMLVTYSYVCEGFINWYSGDEFERYMAFRVRMTGPLAWTFWVTIFCNVVAIQPLWFRKVRRNPWALFCVACFVQLGMWMERFMLIVTAQHRDFLPSSWGGYKPSLIDGAILGGSICFFLFLFLLMLRYVPFIPIQETKETHRELTLIRNSMHEESNGGQLS